MEENSFGTVHGIVVGSSWLALLAYQEENQHLAHLHVQQPQILWDLHTSFVHQWEEQRHGEYHSAFLAVHKIHTMLLDS